MHASGTAYSGAWQVDIKIGSSAKTGAYFVETFYLAERRVLKVGPDYYLDGAPHDTDSEYGREIDIMETHWKPGGPQINLPLGKKASGESTGWVPNPEAYDASSFQAGQWSDLEQRFGKDPTELYVTYGAFIDGSNNLYLYAYYPTATTIAADTAPEQWYVHGPIPRNSSYLQQGMFVPYIGTWTYHNDSFKPSGTDYENNNIKTSYRNFVYKTVDEIGQGLNPKDSPGPFWRAMANRSASIEPPPAQVRQPAVHKGMYRKPYVQQWENNAGFDLVVASGGNYTSLDGNEMTTSLAPAPGTEILHTHINQYLIFDWLVLDMLDAATSELVSTILIEMFTDGTYIWPQTSMIYPYGHTVVGLSFDYVPSSSDYSVESPWGQRNYFNVTADYPSAGAGNVALFQPPTSLQTAWSALYNGTGYDQCPLGTGYVHCPELLKLRFGCVVRDLATKEVIDASTAMSLTAVWFAAGRLCNASLRTVSPGQRQIYASGLGRALADHLNDVSAPTQEADLTLAEDVTQGPFGTCYGSECNTLCNYGIDSDGNWKFDCPTIRAITKFASKDTWNECLAATWADIQKLATTAFAKSVISSKVTSRLDATVEKWAKYLVEFCPSDGAAELDDSLESTRWQSPQWREDLFREKLSGAVSAVAAQCVGIPMSFPTDGVISVPSASDLFDYGVSTATNFACTQGCDVAMKVTQDTLPKGVCSSTENIFASAGLDVPTGAELCQHLCYTACTTGMTDTINHLIGRSKCSPEDKDKVEEKVEEEEEEELNEENDAEADKTVDYNEEADMAEQEQAGKATDEIVDSIEQEVVPGEDAVTNQIEESYHDAASAEDAAKATEAQEAAEKAAEEAAEADAAAGEEAAGEAAEAAAEVKLARLLTPLERFWMSPASS